MSNKALDQVLNSSLSSMAVTTEHLANINNKLTVVVINYHNCSDDIANMTALCDALTQYRIQVDAYASLIRIAEEAAQTKFAIFVEPKELKMPGKVLYTLNEKEVERFRNFATEAIALETMMENFLDTFKRQTEEVQKRKDDFFRKIGTKLPPDPGNFDMFGNLHNIAVEEKDGVTVVVRLT